MMITCACGAIFPVTSKTVICASCGRGVSVTAECVSREHAPIIPIDEKFREGAYIRLESREGRHVVYEVLGFEDGETANPRLLVRDIKRALDAQETVMPIEVADTTILVRGAPASPDSLPNPEEAR